MEGLGSSSSFKSLVLLSFIKIFSLQDNNFFVGRDTIKTSQHPDYQLLRWNGLHGWNDWKKILQRCLLSCWLCALTLVRMENVNKSNLDDLSFFYHVVFFKRCNVTCGTGSQSRSRSIVQLESCGGSVCQGQRKESKACNTHCCPG